MPVCGAAVVSRSQRVTGRRTETTAVLYLSFVLLAVKNSFETSAGSWGSRSRNALNAGLFLGACADMQRQNVTEGISSQRLQIKTKFRKLQRCWRSEFTQSLAPSGDVPPSVCREK